MHLTPEIMELAYNYLKSPAALKKWGLPDADDLEFRVSHSNTFYGRAHYPKRGPMWIEISARLVVTTHQLMTSLAHEMCHIKQAVESERRGAKVAFGHGKDFDKLVHEICSPHGFGFIEVA